MTSHRLAVPFLLALAALAPAQHVRLGTWNLEHFGARDPARTPAQVAKLADYIRGLEVDVLAVQEIRGLAAMRTLHEALGADWDFVLGTTGRFADGERELISPGFLWNRTRVELVQAEELLDLPSQEGDLPIFHRKPVSAVFRTRDGGLDFRAVTVHLKASRGDKNEAKRSAEAGVLAAWIAALYARDGEDRDIVVLGDFNHTYGAPAHQRFTSEGVVEYLPQARRSRTIVHFDEPIDHVAITPGIREELVTGKVVVHSADAERDQDAWRADYSDHLPVTVDLHAVDNDPEATFAPVGSTQWLRAGGDAAAYHPREDDSNVRVAAGPLGAGARVEVQYEGEARPVKVTGTLAGELGDWVQVVVDGGSLIAVPRDRVILVVALGSG